MNQETQSTTVATVDLCVPVHDGLHKIETVEIEDLRDDFDEPIDGHITALINGRPEDHGARVLGVVLNRSGEQAIPKDKAPNLCTRISQHITSKPGYSPDEAKAFLENSVFRQR